MARKFCGSAFDRRERFVDNPVALRGLPNEVIDRFGVASVLREIGTLLLLEGENRYRVRAYRRGAEAIERLEGDLGAMVEADRLVEIDGIGPGLSRVIREVWRTGTSAELERLRRKIPRGVVELRTIVGLSESRARVLYEGLGVDSIEKLRAELERGRVRELKGFGAKAEERIRTALARHERGTEEMRLFDAMRIGERLLERVRRDAISAEVSSELRRRHEVIRRIDLIAASEDRARAVGRFVESPEVVRVESVNEREAIVRLAGGMRASLWAVTPDRWARALVERTGSAEHVAKLFARARERGVELDGSSEEEIYRRLDLPYVPPELREDLGELERPFEPLIERSDVRGFVHCHTRFSDGRATIEEMAKAADRFGAEYMTITDHSPSAFYAKGVEIDRMKRQWDEIAEVQERVKVRLLRGTESDILADGSLDYPDAILEQLDVVIASIHSRHQMGEDAMTERIVRAMRHPLFKIWGHPLGRRLLERPPIAVRMEEVLDAIAESRAAIEISGDPDRMELEPRWIRAARSRGIRFVVSVDAHSTAALEHVELGIFLARRGGVPKREVLNTLPLAEFAAAVRP